MLALKDTENNNTAADKSIVEKVEHCQRLALVLSLTKDMLQAAKAENWEEVASLESLRKADLEACFAQQVLIDESPVVAEAIAALIHLNEELMSLVKQARNAVFKQSGELSKRKAAAASYLKNQ